MPIDTTYARQISAAADEMLTMAAAVTDGMLTRPSPCTDMDLATLLGHIDGLSQAFAAAAHKDFGPMTSTPPDPTRSELSPGWSVALRCHVRELADAWQAPDAWEGMTQAGGVDAPAEVMGTIALSELVLHGWDVARTIGVDYTLDDDVLEVVYDFHHPPGPQSEREGMFGPVVEVPADARLVDRLAGLTGRDPFWPHGTLEE
ncbi:TIGR03086 family protein [Gordonia sp. HNM0687]|uniref:TIGR03086 family protein n=1 Tax=Gordonia mangrovi TaxID=2665643 RepID=A0A6L7GTE4_9ACTN|nr:TIGR03086 family metal-binding protein [Gordonia mangrovi]MXP23289.1 TIGR03086 family protein [Gordonia mangrovi]UVF76793.1 TIGR03086 family metal-binding protein [Gordonia mangrovi]